MVLRVVAFVVMVAAIAGCEEGVSGAVPNRGFGFHYDGITEYGIRYRDDAPDSDIPHPSPCELDQWYLEVSECIGVWTDPNDDRLLLVRTESMPEQSLGRWLEPGLILHRPLILDWHTIKHEYVHYVLYKLTGSPDSAHVSPFFHMCTRDRIIRAITQ